MRAVDSLVGRLPRPVQQWLPSDLPSILLLVAYGWTAFVGFLLVYISIVEWQKYPGVIVFDIPVLVIGVMGLWRGTRLWVVIPASAIWLGLAVVSLLGNQTVGAFVLSASFVACLVVAGWSVTVRFREGRRQSAQTKRTVNQLGWDLYRLSVGPPPTQESTPEVALYAGLRVGEVERHFDQVTYATIQGGMKHEFRIKGMSSSLHNVPGFYYDTATSMRMSGAGVSTVQLGMEGRSSADLNDDAFVAVFERPGSGGVDTLRGVVPSESQSRAYVNQILMLWSSQLVPSSELELMVRRYGPAITQSVSSEASYVGDRLNAILRMPAADRPAVTVIGEPLNHHSVLIAAVRFGEAGPWYQLFPTALIRNLQSLMAGNPLAPPPIDPPTPSAGDEAAATAFDDAPVAQSNGHFSGIRIRTLGGLKIEAAGGDLKSALLDRKVLAFLWLQLLARKLRNPSDTMTRASLADELSPGIDGATQRARLRGRLSELRRELPPAIGSRIEVSGERVSFNLTDVEVDALALLDSAKTVGGSNGVVSPEQLAMLEEVVSHTGPFLPEWDEIEHQVNGARGGAGQVVAELRHRLDNATTTLLRAVGAGHLAHGRAEVAVSFLERALELSPDDEAVARTLLSACLQTGRMSRAEALKKDFALV